MRLCGKPLAKRKPEGQVRIFPKNHFLVSDRNSSNVAGFGSHEDDVLRAADGTSEFAGFVVDVENDLAADVFGSQIVIANDSPCAVEYTSRTWFTP